MSALQVLKAQIERMSVALADKLDQIQAVVDCKNAEIVRLEMIIGTLKAGLNVIARTEHHTQSTAKYMQYEARQTLRIASEADEAKARAVIETIDQNDEWGQ
jgi:hypothetical protein